MAGTGGSIFALGDCTSSSYAPTAQVASQQGAYLGRLFAQMAKQESLAAQLKNAKEGVDPAEIQKQLDKIKFRPFHYSHQGSLA